MTKQNQAKTNKAEDRVGCGWYLGIWIVGGIVFGVLSGSVLVGVLWPILGMAVLLFFGVIAQILKGRI